MVYRRAARTQTGTGSDAAAAPAAGVDARPHVVRHLAPATPSGFGRGVGVSRRAGVQLLRTVLQHYDDRVFVGVDLVVVLDRAQQSKRVCPFCRLAIL